MTTFKILVSNEYRRLQKDIQNSINECILPDIDNDNLCDLLLLFNYHFKNVDTENKHDLIDQIIDMQDVVIDQPKRNKIYPIVYKFVLWLKHIQSA